LFSKDHKWIEKAAFLDMSEFSLEKLVVPYLKKKQYAALRELV